MRRGRTGRDHSYRAGRLAVNENRFSIGNINFLDRSYQAVHWEAIMDKIPTRADAGDIPEARSLTSAVFTNLKVEILSCRLKPGEKLHIGNLAKAYDVSLAAVREALSRLVADGLVIAEDQRGFRVSPASLRDLDDVTETRIEIECLALRRSIARGGADWSEAIEAAWKEMSGARPGNEKWPHLHNRFHASLVGACGLEWLMRFRAVLFEQSERYRALSRGPKTVARDLETEHRELMEATLARDTAAATALLAKHFGRTRDLVLMNYAEPARPLAKDAPPDRTRGLIQQMAKKAGRYRQKDSR
jgi:DNA-binding GntR family transcriptional regulator